MKAIGIAKAREIGNRLRVNWQQVDIKEFTMGMNDELEHRNVTHGNLMTTGMIALAHLKEDAKYYTKLKRALRR